MSHYTVYRGEYGVVDDLSTRCGSLTFCNERKVAEWYATHPNRPNDQMHLPRVISATIQITNPFINQPDDAYLDFSTITQRCGIIESLRIARKFSQYIVNMDGWLRVLQFYKLDPRFTTVDNFLTLFPLCVDKLSMLVYPLADDAEEIAKLRLLGYDGIIVRGTGVSLDNIEYRPFSDQQILEYQVIHVNKEVNSKS